jgi:Flp pilus assembly pilin Flp
MQLNVLGNRIRREGGQTMAEYAVVLGVITLGLVATIGLLSTTVADHFDGVVSIIKSIGT